MTYEKLGIVIPEDALAEYGEKMGRRLQPGGSISGRSIAKELGEALREIRAAHAAAQRRYQGQSAVPSAVEWLLDNWYIAERESLSAAMELRHCKRLRAIFGTGGIFGGGDSILLSVAESIVSSGGGAVSPERCELFLDGFQRGRVLTGEELSLLQPMLMTALVLELRAGCRLLEDNAELEGLGDGMGRLFGSLRLLGTLDMSDTLERVDQTEQLLRRDPAGVYAAMDERTRAYYRRRVADLAEERDTSEYNIARRVLRLSESREGRKRHVGYYLFTKPLGETENSSNGGWYIALNLLLSLALTLAMSFTLGHYLLSLFLFFPTSELVKNAVDFTVLRLKAPRHVPRLELRGGVPEAGRTLCVISALLTDVGASSRFARSLEEFRLANRDSGSNLLFGVLADFPESRDETVPDGARAALDSLAGEIERLNERYGGGFFLLSRERSYSERDKRYMGWERKRGAILELARFLRGHDSGVLLAAGDRSELENVKYILTLDSDTRLLPGTARELIGAMLHPLNRPVVDTKRRVVVSGTAVISPRMAVDLESAGRSDFARITAGQGGCDPYGSATSEVYMDLFSRGSFAGKGIIDIAALLDCLDGAIPENSVLSHDLLEGAYLRGQYMGDVELSDGYPSRVPGYFSRMHRWTRGDWQNSPWLFRRGRALSELDRWKIYDNLRRSLTAPAIFISLGVSFVMAVEWAIPLALISLLALASRLLLVAADGALRRGSGEHTRYHSTIIHGVGGNMLQSLVRLVLLPQEAYICLSAAALALWRMLITRRNMLVWTTAAQTESRGRSGLLFHYRALWFCALTGAALIAFPVSVLGRAFGVIWLFAPIYALSLGRERVFELEPSAEERSYLLHNAKEIWRYFEDFTTAEDNYLPPDNWQSEPPVGTAHRSSPTNIGLGLLSALAALDLGLSEPDSIFALLDHMLDTIERLPKWNGHLYNWYDTRSLERLSPQYISTVDSGNLAGCLLTLSEGLLDYGHPELSARCRALVDAMQFAPLYDPSRRLFRIGMDPERGELTEGWYDLLASEARLAGFIAIAKGEIERRHWRRLGRAQVAKDGYRGMASWTGTMFEYLMPELMLPSYRDSLIYESSRFCVYVHRRRVRSGLPWGISESAFNALDPSLAYRYKAHGAGTLALRRGMDTETVISPYSSFLALGIEPRAAVANLRRLERAGARGRYGFWEAVDYTPRRNGSGDGAVVRCVMAHHLGMSLISIVNYLEHGVMQKRFMRDAAMSGHSGLLQEKVPIGGVIHSRRNRDIPEKPQRLQSGIWEKSGASVNYFSPSATILSNGAHSLLVTESGITRSRAGELLLYRSETRTVGEPRGAMLYLLRGGRLTPILPTPEALDCDYSWRLTSESAAFSAQGNDFKAETIVSLSSTRIAELREISLRSDTSSIGFTELVMTLEPILARESDYRGHPAFYKLGLETYERGGALFVRRLARGELSERFMCIASDMPAAFSASRDSIPGRGGLEAALSGKAHELGWCPDTAITLRITLNSHGGNTTRLRIAMCIGATEAEALEGALELLSAPPAGTELAKGSGSALNTMAECARLPQTAAALYGVSPREFNLALYALTDLAFPPLYRPEAARLRSTAEPGRLGLWRHGLSGDLPIFCAYYSDNNQTESAESLIKMHALLSTCGQNFDLVFLSDDGGDYRRPAHTALNNILRRLGRDAYLAARGGIHLISLAAGTDSLRAAASVYIDLADGLSEDSFTRAKNEVQPLTLSHFDAPVQNLPRFEWDDDGRFSFDIKQSLPPRTWGNMLTNGEFGFFATDCGTGHMWHRNARELRINRWLCDPLATRGTETLELLAHGVRHNLFASPEDTDCRVSFDFGTAVWHKRIGALTVKTTAFVPPDRNARVFIIELEGGFHGARIAWYSDLLLSGDDTDAQGVITNLSDGVLRARNPRSHDPELTFAVISSHEPESFTADRAAWYSGALNSETGAGYDPCFGLIIPVPDSGKIIIAAGVEEPELLRELALSSNAAEQSLASTRKYWERFVKKIEVETPDPALNRMINGWCAYQTLACRYMGRSSVYQSGGAMGFRDQLQDMVNLTMLIPSAARRHILESCRVQFLEGDVLHWWHESRDGARGVRTRCSDDLLWLPWALCEYLDKTGDTGILDESAEYLRSPPLADKERERYEIPAPSGEFGTVLEHCVRALDEILRRGTGTHGLLLMGTGDWNDGMDRVGAGGSGESVWLSWFYAATARRFASILSARGDSENARRYESTASAVAAAANESWDGAWYRRGYFDNGSPLGSLEGESCRIDSIAQSFSVYNPESEPGRRKMALDSALSLLFDRERGVVKLFDPPFVPEHSGNSPGYIESYGPGFRENGGQYTHGAVWLAMACLREGRVDDGYELLKAILPENHDPGLYGAEPFVMPADVYTAPGSFGRAGWSWYTGSAGWYLRAVVEELLGIRVVGGELSVEPRLPSEWEGFSAKVRLPGRDMITVNVTRNGVKLS